ncbi:MAG: prominin family protein [Deltaproteobacteria bacterium]|jgi:RsiW-degrading membrane proteinase PrsW (M82 family)|nr:prominin family protein [Deltaproteobacteria bacterium]
MDPVTVYQTGLIVIVIFALLWSFVLDRNKPPTTKEFVAKLFARTLFLLFIFTVLVGFAYFILIKKDGTAG